MKSLMKKILIVTFVVLILGGCAKKKAPVDEAHDDSGSSVSQLQNEIRPHTQATCGG